LIRYSFATPKAVGVQRLSAIFTKVAFTLCPCDTFRILLEKDRLKGLPVFFKFVNDIGMFEG